MLFLIACEQALFGERVKKIARKGKWKGAVLFLCDFFTLSSNRVPVHRLLFMSLWHTFLSMGIFWIDTVRQMMKRIFYVHISSRGNTRSLWWTERLLGFRRPLTFIKGSRQYQSLSIKLFLENLTKTMYFPLLAFRLVNNITNYLSTLTWSSNNDYG